MFECALQEKGSLNATTYTMTSLMTCDVNVLYRRLVSQASPVPFHSTDGPADTESDWCCGMEGGWLARLTVNNRAHVTNCTIPTAALWGSDCYSYTNQNTLFLDSCEQERML